MKETFAGVRRAYFEQHRTRHSVVRARLYHWAGRICLLGATISGSVEIFSAYRGNMLPPVTLHSLFGWSPDAMAPSLAPLKAAIKLAVDAPFGVVLLAAAVIPYVLAAINSPKKSPAG
jgi:hypothetical protein